MVYRFSPYSLGASGAAAIIITALAAPHSMGVNAIYWCALMLIHTGLRYWLYLRYQSAKPAVEHARLWGSRFVILSAIAGAIWGLLGSGLLHFSDPTLTLLGCTICTAIVGIALPSLSPYFPAFCAFVVPIALPATLFALGQQFPSNFVGISLGVFTVISLGGARRLALGCAEQLRLTIENEKIADAYRQATEAAHAASEAKSRFLATMSHEIRTPLNGMVGTTELLLDTGLNETQRRLVMIANRSSESLLAIISDILDLSKIEAGKLELETIRFVPAQIAEDVVELLAERAQSKGIELACCVAPDVPVAAYGDPGRLRQVLTNLVGNAIKFTDAGEIGVYVRRGAGPDGVRLRFIVTDTGIGIQPEALERLFRPFAQADSSTTRKYGGTGLGLAIARQLVEAMGGTIEAQSGPGRGSRFEFEVPTRVETDALSGSVDRARARRAIVVDRHATTRTSLAEHLDALGVQAVAADRLPDSPGGARGDDIELVLLEAAAPGAIDRARALRGERPAVRIALTVPAAGPEAESLRAAVQSIAGVALLLKPVRREALASLIADRPHAQPEEAPPSEGPRRGRLLLAEDNAVNRTVALTMLRQLGFDVDVAGNGLEAVEAAAKHRYDAVLMDCEMPEMDGFEATARIRSAERGTHVPILALTANAVRGDREKCLSAGMDDYLSKPFRKTQLRAMLEKHVAPAAHAQG